jgi:TolB-like protein/class 3 adenylate cyclase/Flp pilus assembly protein TadD
MSAERKPDLHLEIAHVLFMDVVGFSKLLINDQSEILEQLNQLVRETPHFREAEAAGKLIRLSTGDGMALVFSNSPEAPVECALEISKTLKRYPEIQLRMGVHSGPVSALSDVNDRSNVTGAGINMAQRVMDCGDAGHILVSRHVAEDLEHYARWQPLLHDLGECEVKHGVRVHVFNLYTDEVGNRGVPAKLKPIAQEPAGGAVVTSAGYSVRSKPGLIAATVLLAIALAIGFVFWVASHRAEQKSTSTSQKSIAVMPFANLSEEKANAYFADGIQEEILTRLSKIADLKVISRTSTEQYQTKPGNLSEIAKQLGVANILEGSVQRSADQVRVNVQLIKAATDTHLWADTFDRKLTDVFAVESEIAKAVANTLQAKLSGAEQSAIAARPTENSEAHDLYLKGRYFFGKRTVDDFKRAIDYFNQAIAKDPNYAPAYAGLADSYALLPQWSTESPAEDLPKAKAAADKALALDSNLAEAHVSRGLLFADADLNLKGAKGEFERAIELNANDAEAHYFLGFIVLTPLGDFDHAIAEMNRAVELDPFSAVLNFNLGFCYYFARRYPEAIVQARKAAELDPGFFGPHALLGLVLDASGEREQAITEYQRAYDLSRQSGSEAAYTLPVVIYALKGDRAKALQQLDEVKALAQRGKVPASRVAGVCVRLDDKNEAIEWHQRSYQNKEYDFITTINVDPLLDPLRGDPRFEALVQKVLAPKNASSP